MSQPTQLTRGSGHFAGGKVYLTAYNIIMFVAFSGVFITLIRDQFISKPSETRSLSKSTTTIRILTYTQLLEVVHPMLGLVPGGAFLPFMQVFGRMVVNQMLVDRTICSNSAPFVNYLFMVWSSIEIFRYSFYALRLIKVDIYPITWARYTLFLPLYPMGGFCESQVVLAAVKQFEKTGAYSLSLPNPANISFHSPSFLKFYVYVLLGPGVLHLMRYMWSQRNKQLKVKVD